MTVHRQDDMRSVQIPFSGFYDSIHSWAIDYWAELYFQDDSGEVNGPLYERAWHYLDWQAAQKTYAEEYAEAFIRTFGLEGARFDTMSSPMFYNFETDRIFIWVPESMLARMRAEVDAERFAELCKSKFTSYDGFASHYSPNPGAWPDFADWDHNQLFALLEAWIETRGILDQWAIDSIYDWECEYSQSTTEDLGGAEAALFPAEGVHPEFDRAMRVQNYLRERESRRWRDKGWNLAAL